MNSLTTIHDNLDKSVAARAAGDVLTRTFKELDALHTPDVPSPMWFKSVYDLIIFSQQIEAGFGHAKAYALAIIAEQWEELPVDLRRQFGYTFKTFARNVTGKEPSTIDNYIRTARVWFVQKVNPGRPVEIKIRGEDGKPIVDEYGKQLTQQVEFAPFNVDMTKLLLCNAAAVKGTMTPRLWEMLVDPFYTVADLHRELSENGSPQSFVSPSFFLLGPGLYCEVAGEQYCIAEELNWADYEKGGPVKDAIDRIMKVLDIVFDEDAVYIIEHRGKE